MKDKMQDLSKEELVDIVKSGTMAKHKWRYLFIVILWSVAVGIAIGVLGSFLEQTAESSTVPGKGFAHLQTVISLVVCSISIQVLFALTSLNDRLRLNALIELLRKSNVINS